MCSLQDPREEEGRKGERRRRGGGGGEREEEEEKEGKNRRRRRMTLHYYKHMCYLLNQLTGVSISHPPSGLSLMTMDLLTSVFLSNVVLQSSQPSDPLYRCW